MKFVVLSFRWYLEHFFQIDFLIFKEAGIFDEHDPFPLLSEPVREKTNNLVQNKSDTNQALQSQKLVRGWKFWK